MARSRCASSESAARYTCDVAYLRETLYFATHVAGVGRNMEGKHLFGASLLRSLTMLLRPRTWLPRTRFLMASTLAFTIGVSLSHCGNTVIG